ncbi:hypothetical protein ACFE04_003886 [Oxalis oulophora]
MILKWVSATSRNLAPNNDLGPVISPSLQKGLSNNRAKTEEGLINEEGLYKRVIGNNRAKTELLYKRVMGKIGSSPPSCEHKCYGCTPCEAIQVPTTTTSTKELCPTIKNILLLDSEGKRVAVKYYSDEWPTHSAKLAFEKFVFSKTLKSNARAEADVMMFENNVVIYKFFQDLHFFITGGDNENELILASVLQGFFDAVALLLRNNVDKREALENLDLIFLCFDEIVERGIVLETDASVIAGKVAVQSLDAGAPLTEQTISQALATAREHITRTLLK